MLKRPGQLGWAGLLAWCDPQPVTGKVLPTGVGTGAGGGGGGGGGMWCVGVGVVGGGGGVVGGGVGVVVVTGVMHPQSSPWPCLWWCPLPVPVSGPVSPVP